MQRIIGWFNRLEELTLTLTLLGLALVSFVQVCTRYTVGLSFDWLEEGGRYLGVFITFLGAAIGVKRGSHFTMDALVAALPAPLGKAIRVGVAVFSGIIFLVVAWYGFKVVGRNYRFEATSASLGVPMYVVYLPIPVLSILIGVRFFLSIGRALRGDAPRGGE